MYIESIARVPTAHTGCRNDYYDSDLYEYHIVVTGAAYDGIHGSPVTGKSVY